MSKAVLSSRTEIEPESEAVGECFRQLKTLYSSQRVLSATQNTVQQSESAFINSKHCTAVRECFHQLKTLYSLIEENHQLHRYSQYHWHNSTLGNIVIYSKYNEAHIHICTQTSIHIIMFACIHTRTQMHACTYDAQQKRT